MGVDILRFDGFAIRRQKMSKPLCAWGFAIPSNRFGSFVIGGLQIRRDGKSVVKKCPNLFVPGDLQSPVIGSGSFVIVGLQIPRFHRSNLFFYGGFQIRRDGRGLADSEEKSAPSAKFA